jgi:hypothetical protein
MSQPAAEKRSQHIAKAEEHLWVYSMGKRFRVMGIFEGDAGANAYCEKHDSAAVIACFGTFVIVANKYEGEAELCHTQPSAKSA